MKYKVGDEVLVKVRIHRIVNHKTDLPYEVKRINNEKIEPRTIWIREEDIQSDSQMTAEEAWDIAKNLFADYSNSELDEIFGKGWSFPKLMELTPQQAKTKIEAWEAEKEIKAGDEVALKEDSSKDEFKFFVTRLDKKENRIAGFSVFDGDVFWGRDIAKYQKTGRHIDINWLLKQIGTLEEVREAMEKQRAKKALLGGNTDKLTGDIRICPCCCGIVGMDDMRADYCAVCGRRIDWSEVENER